MHYYVPLTLLSLLVVLSHSRSLECGVEAVQKKKDTMNRKTPNYFSPIPLSSFYTTSEIHSSHTKKDIKSEKAKKCLFCYVFSFFLPLVWEFGRSR